MASSRSADVGYTRTETATRTASVGMFYGDTGRRRATSAPATHLTRNRPGSRGEHLPTSQYRPVSVENPQLTASSNGARCRVCILATRTRSPSMSAVVARQRAALPIESVVSSCLALALALALRRAHAIGWRRLATLSPIRCAWTCLRRDTALVVLVSRA